MNLSFVAILALCVISRSTTVFATPFSFLDSAYNGQHAKLDIRIWKDFGCPGQGNVTADILYGGSYEGLVKSYSLSRDLGLSEQLDFSQGWDFDRPQGPIGYTACARFLEKGNPDSNGHTLRKGVCYNLTKSDNVTAMVSVFVCEKPAHR